MQLNKQLFNGLAVHVAMIRLGREGNVALLKDNFQEALTMRLTDRPLKSNEFANLANYKTLYLCGFPAIVKLLAHLEVYFDNEKPFVWIFSVCAIWLHRWRDV